MTNASISSKCEEVEGRKTVPRGMYESTNQRHDYTKFTKNSRNGLGHGWQDVTFIVARGYSFLR
jgi:hypothetical protein